VKEEHTRMMLTMMIQKTKQDIVYQRMNLPPSAQHKSALSSKPHRAFISSYLVSTCSIISAIHRTTKYKQAISNLKKYKKLILLLKIKNNHEKHHQVMKKLSP
jgi:hypothetical protein